MPLPIKCLIQEGMQVGWRAHKTARRGRQQRHTRGGQARVQLTGQGGKCRLGRRDSEAGQEEEGYTRFHSFTFLISPRRADATGRGSGAHCAARRGRKGRGDTAQRAAGLLRGGRVATVNGHEGGANAWNRRPHHMSACTAHMGQIGKRGPGREQGGGPLQPAAAAAKWRSPGY